MLTREQIEEIQTESREKGISVKNLLKEKGIPDSQYFWWKRKYSKQEVPEGFLPVAGGGLPASIPAQLAGAGASSRGKSKPDASGENWMSIELRTVGGTDMRIQGGLSPAMVYTILKSLCYVQPGRWYEILALLKAYGHAEALQHAEWNSNQPHGS